MILFFVSARFRQPLIPILIIFAVYGVISLFDFIKEKNKIKIITASIFFLIFFFVSNMNLLGVDHSRIQAENHLMFGNAFLRLKKLDQAALEFQKSIDQSPTFARGYVNLGMVQTNQNNYSDAVSNFEQALSLNANLPEIYFNLAVCYLKSNNRPKAISILERGCLKVPLNDVLHTKLGIEYLESGKLDLAKTTIEKALRLNDKNETAKLVYQEILRRSKP
jgi:tetratricopeptide (TPR) repeat protein